MNPATTCCSTPTGSPRHTPAPGGEQLGLDRLIDFTVKAIADQFPPPETTRRLVHANLDHQDNDLHDDATVLLVHWRSPRTAVLRHRSGRSPPDPPLDLAS